MSKRPLSVLHVTFDMGIGGTEQVIKQLVTNMDPGLATHDIVCIDGTIGPVGETLATEGIQVTGLNRRPGLDRSLIRSLRRLIREGRFDIVHCHQYTPFFYGRLAAFGTQARVVFTEHGRFHPDRYRWKAIVVNRVLGLLTPAIVAISEATRKALAQYEFIPRGRIQVIYNGIRALDVDKHGAGQVRQACGIPATDIVMGTVARLDPVKNQILMLRSFAEVLTEHPDCWLLIVGDGPDRQKLESLSRDLGIDRRVIFVGFKNLPADYLSAMDLFLLSSHTEGTSMTLLEAMSLGIPSVVTRVGGNPEIISHERTGLLTVPDDIGQFTEAILRLIKERALYQALKENCRREFERRFSVDGMAENYGNLYKEVLGKSPV